MKNIGKGNRRTEAGMISHREIEKARDEVLDRAISYFAELPDVVGVWLGGSLPAGSSDAYSDIDLKVIAPPDEQARLVAARLEMGAHWGDLLFNEWLDEAFHCIYHFRPFVKMDVFYVSTEIWQPSPWLRFPAKVFLDRTGAVRGVLERSATLSFPAPASREVSRVLSKALAGLHEVVRRTRRGEALYAQALLGELRHNMIRLDDWICGFTPSHPADLKLERRLTGDLEPALKASYVDLDAHALEAAAVRLSEVLVRQIRELHSAYALARSLENDLFAAEVVRGRQVA